MNRLSFASVLVCAPMLLVQTTPPQTPASTQSIEAAIRSVADQYMKATLAGDAKAVAALYTEDAVEMPPNEPPIKGRTAIQQHYEKLLKGGKVSRFTLSHLEARSSGDIAYDVGTYDQSTTPTGGAEMPDTGKFVVILKRTGGTWRVAYAIYNSDHSAVRSK